LQPQNEQKQTTSGTVREDKVIQNGKLLCFQKEKSFPFLSRTILQKLP
jgi:hypothetical protein